MERGRIRMDVTSKAHFSFRMSTGKKEDFKYSTRICKIPQNVSLRGHHCAAFVNVLSTKILTTVQTPHAQHNVVMGLFTNDNHLLKGCRQKTLAALDGVES